jgi:hypothetical protein
VTQAVEHLLCKREALSSNPRPTKKKKKEREKKRQFRVAKEESKII